MTKIKPTSPVPLFDKLVDQDPDVQEEAAPLRTYTRDQLKESIRREVSLILNHRRSLPSILGESEEVKSLLDTVLFFGTTDFSNLNYRRDTAWQMRVEDEIAEAIHRFEPRLTDVHVDIQEFNQQTRVLSVFLSGVITVDQVREQITFPVDITGFAENISNPQRKMVS